MTLTLTDVQHLADLSRLSFTDQELQNLLNELNEIIGYVEQLKDVDVSGLTPTTQVTGLKNVWRDDQVEDLYAGRETLLANAPAQQDGYIKVRRVL